MFLAQLTKQRSIAILWYGLEGQSTYRFLLAHGYPPEQITILDKNTNLDLPPSVHHQLWASYLTNLEQFSLVIKTPGITNQLISTTLWHLPAVQFISQTELFLYNYTGTIIWVTGTKGKSTISMLAYLTLAQAGKNVVLAGNIGKPVLDLIDWTNQPDIVVYELSSFMIESVFSDRHGRKIDIAIFNTIYSTHTNEHGGYDNYVKAKLLLLDHAHHTLIGDQVIDTLGKQFPTRTPPPHTQIYGHTGTYTRNGTDFCKQTLPLFAAPANMLLVGEHNKTNTCALVGICDLLDIPFVHLISVLRTFWWLEHRLECVGTYDGIIRYNDAIATTPQATAAALDSFWAQVDTLFYGGIIGEYDHQLVADKIVQYGIRHLVLFPDTWSILYACLPQAVAATVNVYHTRSMEDGVNRARQHTTKGKIALLSCGSPSFSVWSSFVEKWTRFKAAVRENTITTPAP